MKCLKTNRFWVFFSLLPVFQALQDTRFEHDVDVKHPQSGEHVKLKSSGRLTEAIDLDRVSGIKRVVCQEGKILVAVDHKGVGKEWRKGQVVIGSAKWDCSVNTLPGSSPGQRGVYAKIKDIFFPTDTGVVLHTETVRPFDLIDEADIKFRYFPGQSADHPPETRRRHRRYIANVLSQILGNITWQYSNTTSIPWNREKPSPRPFGLAIGENDTDFRFIEQTTDDDILSVFCKECTGISHLSYEFDLVIKKNAMNEPEIHRYLNKLESNTTMALKAKVSTSKDIILSINKEIEMLRVQPTMLFAVPIAHVRNLPPVMLTVKYASTTHMDLKVHTISAVSTETDVKLNGKYTFLQEYNKQSSLNGEVKPSNWSSITKHNSVKTDSDMSVNLSVYQQILFNTTIGWFARDMEIDFSPPISYRIKPTFRSISSADDVQRCTMKSVDLLGEFNVTEARLTVEAFGISIWNTSLAGGFKRKVNFENETIYQQCLADCPRSEPPVLYDKVAMTNIIKSSNTVIRRKEPNFKILTQVWGDSILFSSEEYNSSEWCGFPGRQCMQCVFKGSENISKECADRLMVPELASKISLLGKFVKAEWPDKKLFIVEAWDEPTSVHPKGKHGNNSLYYEGKAAQLSVTFAGNSTFPPNIIHDANISKRLGQMAVCSDFEYVSKNKVHNTIEVAVGEKIQDALHPVYVNKKQATYSVKENVEKKAMILAMKRLETTLNGYKCPDIGITMLRKGETFPENRNLEDVCGQPVGQLHREKMEEMEKLYEYEFEDLNFLPEGSSENQCGTGRRCINEKYSGKSSPWDWSANRIMTPRLAFRMRRLAVIAKSFKELDGDAITVEKAFSDSADKMYSALYQEARGAKLTVGGNPTKTAILGRAAICAGFDFVRNVDGTSIEVFVKLQGGFRTILLPYPSGEVFLSVEPPSSEKLQYQYPDLYRDENKKPLLIDGSNEDIHLSEHFKIKDFKFRDPSRTYRYLRVDSSLVECLETAQQNFKGSIKIIRAFRPKSCNTKVINWSERQLARFQMGQAVEIKPQNNDEILDLAKMLMVSCTPSLRLERRGISLHVRTESIYVDIYPLRHENKFIDLKIERKGNTKKDQCLWNQLKRYWSEITTGGPGIIPYDEKHACKEPELGRQKSYLNFNINRPESCLQLGDKTFCKSSKQAREKTGKELSKQLENVAGSDRLDKKILRTKIHSCLVDDYSCGGCSGSGPIWDRKVKACSGLIDHYMQRASKPLIAPDEKLVFFNPENINSAARRIACKDTCQENVQLYSIFQSVLTQTYKPNPNNSIEEDVYGATENPNPLLQIVEQELAMSAAGNVSVVIEDYKDMSVLRNILKILMIHNLKTSYVNFHIMNGIEPDRIISTLQSKLATWAGTSCPLWSRFAAAPFTVNVVSKERKRRSVMHSRQRNEARQRGIYQEKIIP